jgi:eukaryotic-like serine/threonine-protein kinase
VAGVSIDLRVASGNNLVPDVRGLDASTAGARLTAAGFPSAVVSGGSPGDLVIVYAPQGSVPLGTAVSLTVAPASVPTPTPDAPPTPSASPSATPTMSPTPTVMPTPTR